MAIFYPTRFKGEIHLYVEDKMTTGRRPSHWHGLMILQYFERHGDVIHLFGDRILPSSIAVPIIDLLGVLDPSRDLNSIFVGAFEHPRANGRDYVVPFSESVGYPPREGRLVSDATSYCELCDFDRVGFL